jgi:ABC-2 type transport system ATP-binding protein
VNPPTCRCSRLDQLEAASDGAEKRGIPRLFMIENDYVIALLRTEVEFTRRLVAEIESGEMPGIDRQRPAVGPDERGDGADEGGLAGAVGPQQGHDLAAVGDEVEPGQRLDLAEALGEAAGLDDGSGCIGHLLVGLAGQNAAVEEAMTGRENLRMVARLFGLDRRTAAANADAVLTTLGLADAADRLVRTYSGGMRRRLDLGASLVGAPRLLLLDEPTTGLDPRSRLELWDAIRALVAVGTDVLLTTQYLDEADNLADQIVIVDHGRVIAQGAPAELKAQAGKDVVEIHGRRVEDLGPLAGAVAPIGSDEPRIDHGSRRVTVPVDSGTAAVTAAVRAVEQLGIEIDDIGLRRPTLDEVFLTLTGHAAEEHDPEDNDAASDAA